MSKFKVGQVWVTRDGRKARILSTDLNNEQPIVCAVADHDGVEFVIECCEDGRYYTLAGDPEGLDLIREHREPREVWVVFGQDSSTPLDVRDEPMSSANWAKFREVIE